MATNIDTCIDHIVPDISAAELSFSKEEENDFLADIDSAPKEVSILCAGLTGTGKSTLLNGLVGEFSAVHGLSSGTKEILKKTFKKNGILATVWDTPGLEETDKDEQYLEDIKQKCTNIDLFIYCIKANRVRATELSKMKCWGTLHKFTEIFGPKIWENAIVALTFSNALALNLEDETELNVEKKFLEIIKKWKKKVQEALKEGKVDKKVIQKVLVMPTGKKNLHLPGYKYWLSQFFLAAFQQLKDEAQCAFILLNKDRFKSIDEEQDLDSIAKLEVERQPILVKTKIATASAVSGTAAALTVGGATVGSTIGALLIGIPTFGVFAGIGLVIGALVGGSISGISATVVGYLLYVWHKKKKRKKATFQDMADIRDVIATQDEK